jgi:hypothetical protein
MLMVDERVNIRGWAVMFVRKDMSVKDLLERHEVEDAVEILRQVADYVEIEHRVANMFARGESIWEKGDEE